MLALTTLWGLWSHNWRSQNVWGITKKNVSLIFSQNLSFSIHHFIYQALSFQQALHQEKASLSTHYGAITGLAELGQEVGTNKYKMICLLHNLFNAGTRESLTEFKSLHQAHFNFAKFLLLPKWCTKYITIFALQVPLWRSKYVQNFKRFSQTCSTPETTFISTWDLQVFFTRLLIIFLINIAVMSWISNYTNLGKIKVALKRHF